MKLEVKVFVKGRHTYEWRVYRSDEAMIAKGRVGSYAKAQVEGQKQAKQLAKRKWSDLI